MKISDKMLKNGNWLFKYRGQLPIALFLIAIPIISETSYYNKIDSSVIIIIQYSAIIISIIGLFLRYYTIGTTPTGTSGKNRDIQIAKKLNTTGIYSLVRNPLYLGNYIIWLGITIYSLSYILIIVASLFFLFIYEKIILVEENFLSNEYPEKYPTFMNNTPVFFPNFKNYEKSKIKFSIKKILRQEYSSTLSTIISFLYIDILIRFFILNMNNDYTQLFTNTHVIILLTGITVGLLLKIMKTLKK